MHSFGHHLLCFVIMSSCQTLPLESSVCNTQRCSVVFPFATGSTVIADMERSSVLLTCSLWCYGHHTLMLCALPSQECCDVEIKALDLGGRKPRRRRLRSCRVGAHTRAHGHTVTHTEKPHGRALFCCATSVFCSVESRKHCRTLMRLGERKVVQGSELS